jgi:hypothetical protein
MADWTMTLPTRAGWYWYCQGNREPQLGEIAISPNGLAYLWEVGEGNPTILSPLQGYWWAGPLEAPAFPHILQHRPPDAEVHKLE